MPLPLVVLDASAALAMLFADEEGDQVAILLRDVVENSGQVIVPALFWYELGNAMLSAQRRGRISAESSQEAAILVDQLPIVTRTGSEPDARDRIRALSLDHDLTYYDAAYLELALRLQCRLKTYDHHLLALQSRYPGIV